MANRLFTGTTCNNGLTFTFIADDLIITANPINRVYQLVNGSCITVTASGNQNSALERWYTRIVITSRAQLSFLPFRST